MYCNFCGKSIPDTAKTCSACGSLVKPAIRPEGDTENQTQTPSYNYQTNPIPSDATNPMQQREPVMTMWQYVLTFVLINLPVAGLIFLIVFSFDKQKPNRANMCRGFIVYSLIITVFSLILFGIVLFLGLTALDDFLAELLKQIGDSFSKLFDTYNAIP